MGAVRDGDRRRRLGRTLNVTPKSEDFIPRVMGRPVRITRRVTTSLEELELWVKLGEWPRERPDQSNIINHENTYSVSL